MAKYYGEKKSMGMFPKGKPPGEVKMQDYPKGFVGTEENYVDTREGLDALAMKNHAKMRKNPGSRS